MASSGDACFPWNILIPDVPEMVSGGTQIHDKTSPFFSYSTSAIKVTVGNPRKLTYLVKIEMII